LENGERNIHFRRRTIHVNHLHYRSLSQHRIDECGLADAGIPTHNQHTAVTFSRTTEQREELLLLTSPA
jgi:hypothetical protein